MGGDGENWGRGGCGCSGEGPIWLDGREGGRPRSPACKGRGAAGGGAEGAAGGGPRTRAASGGHRRALWARRVGHGGVRTGLRLQQWVFPDGLLLHWRNKPAFSAALLLCIQHSQKVL